LDILALRSHSSDRPKYDPIKPGQHEDPHHTQTQHLALQRFDWFKLQVLSKS